MDMGEKSVIYFELFGSFSIGNTASGGNKESIIPGKTGKKVLSFL